MENATITSTTLVLDNWKSYVSRTSKLFDSLTDEQLARETSPGRNTGIYLLGHLAAVHDALLPLLGLGERLRPELEEVFIKNPEKSGLAKPSISELRAYWTEVNEVLNTGLSSIDEDGWLAKHTLVSQEDFALNPSRNKLNVLLSRYAHLAYHAGQLVYLK